MFFLKEVSFFVLPQGQTPLVFHGIFFQEPVLFASSIKHNIMQGSPDASKEDFMKACQDTETSGGLMGEVFATQKNRLYIYIQYRYTWTFKGVPFKP